MIDWIASNWVPVVGTGLTLISLGLGARSLEFRIRKKRSDDNKAVYDRLRAIEISQSDQRAETKRIDESLNNSYQELREGCQVLEGQLYDCVKISNQAAGYVKGKVE